MKAIEMRLAGIPVKVVMQKLNIKNYSQLKNWMKWHKEAQIHRLAQSVEKQYSFNAELSEIEELKEKTCIAK